MDTFDTFNALYCAIDFGEIDVMRTYWSLDVVNHDRDALGEPLLSRAIRHNQCEIVEFMLENGADPNVRWPARGLTPLMVYMSTTIQREARRLLYKHGANPFLKDSNGLDSRAYYADTEYNPLWCYSMVEVVCGEADNMPLDLWRVVKPFLYKM